MEPEPIPSPELLNDALDVPLTPRPPVPPRPVVAAAPLVPMLTPDDVAAVLRVRSEVVRSWLRSGRLRGAFIGRVWRIHPADLEAFVAAHVPPSAAEAEG